MFPPHLNFPHRSLNKWNSWKETLLLSATNKQLGTFIVLHALWGALWMSHQNPQISTKSDTCLWLTWTKGGTKNHTSAWTIRPLPVTTSERKSETVTVAHVTCNTFKLPMSCSKLSLFTWLVTAKFLLFYILQSLCKVYISFIPIKDQGYVYIMKIQKSKGCSRKFMNPKYICLSVCNSKNTILLH